MSQLKLVIFDCDGVMFDSKNANKLYYNQILQAIASSLKAQAATLNLEKLSCNFSQSKYPPTIYYLFLFR